MQLPIPSKVIPGSTVGNGVVVGSDHTPVDAGFVAANKANLPFNVKEYGAKGDSVLGRTGSITNGQSTLTDTNASFTAQDVGKRIILRDPWGQHAASFGTITAIGSSTSVAVSFAANATYAAAAVYVYGTDDTTAIQAAYNATPAGGKLFFPAGIYIFHTITGSKAIHFEGEGHSSWIGNFLDVAAGVAGDNSDQHGTTFVTRSGADHFTLNGRMQHLSFRGINFQGVGYKDVTAGNAITVTLDQDTEFISLIDCSFEEIAGYWFKQTDTNALFHTDFHNLRGSRFGNGIKIHGGPQTQMKNIASGAVSQGGVVVDCSTGELTIDNFNYYEAMGDNGHTVLDGNGTPTVTGTANLIQLGSCDRVVLIRPKFENYHGSAIKVTGTTASMVIYSPEFGPTTNFGTEIGIELANGGATGITIVDGKYAQMVNFTNSTPFHVTGTYLNDMQVLLIAETNVSNSPSYVRNHQAATNVSSVHSLNWGTLPVPTLNTDPNAYGAQKTGGLGIGGALGIMSTDGNHGIGLKMNGNSDTMLVFKGVSGAEVIEMWTGIEFNAAFGGYIKLPTSSSGLPSGALWNNGGTPAIVP